MLPLKTECPDCKSSLPADATSCGCGWKKGKPQRTGGIQDCAWISDGEQCHYPGTGWSNTHGVGPGYCCFHAMSGLSMEQGKAIVLRSRSYAPRTQAQRYHDAVFGENRPRLLACQSTLCPPSSKALPGRDLCESCAKREDAGEKIPRIRHKPGITRMRDVA